MRRLLACFLVLLGAAFLATGPAAPAQAAAPAECEYPACVCPTVTVSTTTPAAGERFGVGGINFAPNRTMTLVLMPVRDTNINETRTLKTVRSDADGNFDTTVALPTRATGTYDIGVRGGAADGTVCPADPTVRLDVTVLGLTDNPSDPSGNTEESTAFTGFNMLWLLLLAAALVGGGVYANRRGTKTEVRSIHG